MLLWLLWPPVLCVSQVGIGTDTPNSKSILDLHSTTQGLLIPRMTGTERAQLELTEDDIGMMVFQTDVAPAPLPPTPKGETVTHIPSLPHTLIQFTTAKICHC